ncbi:hypothetical protein C8Q77DRAFT_1117517 [Trametes polyzona]|nr:hypothetical protein C8Q77DRAFT_1117517 [Trametes polyzona]
MAPMGARTVSCLGGTWFAVFCAWSLRYVVQSDPTAARLEQLEVARATLSPARPSLHLRIFLRHTFSCPFREEYMRHLLGIPGGLIRRRPRRKHSKSVTDVNTSVRRYLSARSIRHTHRR